MGRVPAQVLVDCGVIWGQQHLLKLCMFILGIPAIHLARVYKGVPVIFFPWLTTVSSQPGVKEWEGLPLILMLVSSLVLKSGILSLPRPIHTHGIDDPQLVDFLCVENIHLSVGRCHLCVTKLSAAAFPKSQ